MYVSAWLQLVVKFLITIIKSARFIQSAMNFDGLATKLTRRYFPPLKIRSGYSSGTGKIIILPAL